MTRVLAADIFAAAAAHAGLSLPEFLGPERRPAVSHPRQRAMFVTRAIRPDLSLPRIGQIAGGRDHTTVLHGLRAVRRRMAKSPDEVRELAVLYDLFMAPELTRLDLEIQSTEATLERLRAERAQLVEGLS